MIWVCTFARCCQKCGSEIVQYGVSIVRCKDKFCKIRYSTFKHTVFFSLKISPSTFLKIVDIFFNNLPFEIISRITRISKSKVSDMIYKFNKELIYNKYLESINLWKKRKYNGGWRKQAGEEEV